jgi:transitional endoplasmic reticulum ATPase
MVEWPLMHQELMAALDCAPHNGILIAGPPGSGKTLLAQAAAKESGVNFITIKGPELISKYVGDSEKAVRDTFKKARQAAPCIVFFDDLEALTATAGGSTHDLIKRVVSQLQSEMDSIENLKDVMVLAATSSRDLIDPALLRPGRFDLTLTLGLPDREARRAIFEIHLKKKPLAPDVDLETLAELSRGMSGADIALSCREAVHRVMREAVAGGVEDASGLMLDMETIRASVERVKSRGMAAPAVASPQMH